MDSTITVFLIRHPSYQKLFHAEEQFLQVSSKIITLSYKAHREMTEAMWLFTRSEIQHGIRDFESLRTFTGVYSTPSIRGVLGCLALLPNTKIKQKIGKTIDYKMRTLEKYNFYNSLQWNSVDMQYLPKIIEAELELELIAYVDNILVQDDFYDLLDISPRWTGANSELFRSTMNKTKFSAERVEHIITSMQSILLQGKTNKPKRFIFMMHGSNMAFLRKYGRYMFNDKIPKSATTLTYEQIKYDHMSIDRLIYHGCGIVLRFKNDGTFLSQEDILIRQELETNAYDWQKRMIFKNPAFLPSSE